MERNGRYNHIEDILAELHTGQWFTFTDAHNKTYNDIIILDDSKDKPTEKELTDALAKKQSDFDAQEYARNRQAEYPSIPDQLDEIYHNGIDSWKAVIKVTKDKYSKG